MRLGLARALLALALTSACTKASEGQAPAPLPPVAPEIPVPPVAVADTLDGALPGDGAPPSTPLEQARVHAAAGQLWLARLTIEKRALGADGAPDELALLTDVCKKQGDEDCLERVAKKRGVSIHDLESRVPEARKLVARGKLAEARDLLRPALDAEPPHEGELRLLVSVCTKLRDAACSASAAKRLE